MDRQEFCNILAERRKELGYTWLDMVIKSDVVTNTVMSCVKGKLNASMDTVIKVIDALQLYIEVKNNNVVFCIDSLQKLSEWCNVSLKLYNSTTSNFVQESKIERGGVYRVLKNETIIRLDNFLKWANTTEFTVELKQK